MGSHVFLMTFPSRGLKSGHVSWFSVLGCLRLQEDGCEDAPGKWVRVTDTDKLGKILDWHFSFLFNYERMLGVLLSLSQQ